MEKTQKEYYLNEQMKAIQKELGENDDLDDIAELEKKIERIIQESLDNQPIEIKMEGDWKQFGKLTFNDRVWTDE